MKNALRAPAYPLITIDPYTSFWSMNDRLNGEDVKHWTGRPSTIIGLATIDGKEFCFMGNAHKIGSPAMEQTNVEFDSFSTTYTFVEGSIELTVKFTSPVIPNDLMLISRPVSYIHTSVRSLDNASHDVTITLKANEQVCNHEPPHCPVFTNEVEIEDLTAIRIGGQEQAILGRAGDNFTIDWGYAYFAAADSKVDSYFQDNLHGMIIETKLNTASKPSSLFVFAYDDIDSLIYFGDRLKAYWKKDGQTIEEAIKTAYDEYDEVMARCNDFDSKMVEDAIAAGGEKYSELLQLALRQVMAGHKLVLDNNKEVLFVSKECFSNGCAATVDVSYPSMPLFLLYNPELVKGMMRPVFRYADSPVWPFEFAPHDVGTYPILNGQVYSNGTDPQHQMPIEECGNMLVMAAAIASTEDNAEFSRPHKATLKQWADYLTVHGTDPENQLCTDDFSGHLAHNCNLSIKAIMGVASFSILSRMWGDAENADTYMAKAKEMAKTWIETASNEDGTTRLTFDRPGTYSMKYNAVWDKLFGTELFDAQMWKTELKGYERHVNAYGLPLDNRADFTKSDWLVWTATLSNSKEQFMDMIAPMWLAYHVSHSHVPMTDWYSTVSSHQCGFQHRTVQGGLWIKILADKGICNINK